MMTASEADPIQPMAQKGRSASFCVTGQVPPSLPVARSSSQLHEDIPAPEVLILMQASQNSAVRKSPSRLRPSGSTSSSRRSSSCRIAGAKPPRVPKRSDTEGDEQGEINQEEFSISNEVINPYIPTGFSNLPDIYLKKVGSCSGLVNLSLEDAPNGSPKLLRRTASARRHLPSRSPLDSPSSARISRSPRASSVKHRPSSRRGTIASTCTPKKGYLDVQSSSPRHEQLDPEAYLLRNFQTTNKGIVNRGDSFRRRRSRSNSVQPSHESPCYAPVVPQGPVLPSVLASPESPQESKDAPAESFRMVVAGGSGVGKTSLMSQFTTSECINAYDRSSTGDEKEETVSIVLNNIESEITFINVTTVRELQEEMQQCPAPDGWLLVYSVTDKASFQRSADDLLRIQAGGLIKGKVLILAGNKCELVRSRAVSYDDGRDLAINHGGKFMEISVGINHKCDDLLVGILNQLRLKAEEGASALPTEDRDVNPLKRNKSFVRVSMKAKRFVNKIIGKSDSKIKQCEDFLN